MKQKAFTLVELLMVITILGIIALIAVPTVTNIITSSKEKAYTQQIQTIENTARTYYASHSNELPNEGYVCKTLEELKTAGLLSNDDIINPKTQAPLTGKIKITLKKSNNKTVKYTYEYTENCT